VYGWHARQLGPKSKCRLIYVSKIHRMAFGHETTKNWEQTFQLAFTACWGGSLNACISSIPLMCERK
jgi:hypothetical protein